jgi:hypothetical protein
VVTESQHFGIALNLNIHFHLLFLEGMYVERPDGSLRSAGWTSIDPGQFNFGLNP